MIQKEVKRAFSLIKDLAVPASLLRKIPDDFNFETGEVEEDLMQPIAIRVVFVETTKKEYTFEASVMFEAKGIDDINLYDKIVADGIEWKISSKSNTDSFIYTLDVYRELK
jgi:hypothetical protein